VPSHTVSTRVPTTNPALRSTLGSIPSHAERVAVHGPVAAALGEYASQKPRPHNSPGQGPQEKQLVRHPRWVTDFARARVHRLTGRVHTYQVIEHLSPVRTARIHVRRCAARVRPRISEGLHSCRSGAYQVRTTTRDRTRPSICHSRRWRWSGRALRATQVQRGRPPPVYRHFESATSRSRTNATPGIAPKSPTKRPQPCRLTTARSRKGAGRGSPPPEKPVSPGVTVWACRPA